MPWTYLSPADLETVAEVERLGLVHPPSLEKLGFAFLDMLDAVDEHLSRDTCDPPCDECDHLGEYWQVLTDLSDAAGNGMTPTHRVREKERWYQERIDARETEKAAPLPPDRSSLENVYVKMLAVLQAVHEHVAGHRCSWCETCRHFLDYWVVLRESFTGVDCLIIPSDLVRELRGRHLNRFVYRRPRKPVAAETPSAPDEADEPICREAV